MAPDYLGTRLVLHSRKADQFTERSGDLHKHTYIERTMLYLNCYRLHVFCMGRNLRWELRQV